jgi:hypothetical protein
MNRIHPDEYNTVGLMENSEADGNTVRRLDFCTMGWVECNEMNGMMDGTQGD